MKYHMNLLYAVLISAAIALAVPIQPDELSTATDLIKREPPGKFQDFEVELTLFKDYPATIHFTWDCLEARFVRKTRGAGAAVTGVSHNTGPGQETVELAIHPNAAGVIPTGRIGNSKPIPFVLQGQSTQFNIEADQQDDGSWVVAVGDWKWPHVFFARQPLTAINQNTFEASVVEIPLIRVGPVRYSSEVDPFPAEGEGFNDNSDSSTNFAA